MLSFDIFQRKIHSFMLKGYQELFENHPKKFWFPKSCPHKKLAEQIFHIQPPNSSMLWFGMFQWKILSVLLKGCHELFDNRPKKFWFPKSCPQEHCPSKYFTFSHQIQVCCALVCSNERSTVPCSKRIMNYSKIAQRKFDFPKVVHIHHCLSKYFTYSHQIQVCSALVCSNERGRVYYNVTPSFQITFSGGTKIIWQGVTLFFIVRQIELFKKKRTKNVYQKTIAWPPLPGPFFRMTHSANQKCSRTCSYARICESEFWAIILASRQCFCLYFWFQSKTCGQALSFQSMNLFQPL